MIIIPAILESYRSLKDRTLKLSFDCNELTPEQTIGIVEGHQKFGFLAFKQDPFTNSEKSALEELEASYEDKTKTHSQRLRAVLFRNWESNNEGFKDFETYYKYRMEELINHFKSLLQ
jgi:hypothetical protein